MFSNSRLFCLFVAVLFLSYSTAYSAIWYVSPSGTGTGTSWADASGDLRTTILSASSGDEVWVMEGIYKASPSNRNVSFKMRNGVAVYGGFDGTESLREERNFVANKTYLSGDLQDDDGPAFTNRDDNTYRILESIGHNDQTILDGFEIRGGHAFAIGKQSGAGVYMENSSMVLRNCILTRNDCQFNGGALYAPLPDPGEISSPTIEFVFFVDNKAGLSGGAAYISAATDLVLSDLSFARNEVTGAGGGLVVVSSDGIIEECRFVANTAFSGGGLSLTSSDVTVSRCIFKKNVSDPGNGGAVHMQSATGSVETCLFQDNRADDWGGGMYINDGTPSLTNCGFIANESGGRGGGLYMDVDPGNPIVNCVFLGNYAQHYGGGLYGLSLPAQEVINCSFSGNRAIVLGGGICSGSSNVIEVRNSILWENSTETASLGITPNPITYSDVQGGYTGIGNINLDPLFVNTPDFMLAPTKIGDLRPSDGSPVIDAGSDAAVPPTINNDVLGNSRFVGPVDMGAYEFPFAFRLNAEVETLPYLATQFENAIYLQVENVALATLFDLNGKIISNTTVNASAQIATGNVPAGIYLLEIDCNGQRFTEQFFIR